MKIAITAPIYITNQAHVKYLNLTTKSIFSSKHEIVWLPCENYVNPAFTPLTYKFDHPPSSTTVLHPDGAQSVSKAWNLGITEASKEGCDYVLVINTDLVFKCNAIDRLVDFAERHKEAVMWTMTEAPDLENLEGCDEKEDYSEHPHFSGFMVKLDFFSGVGRFDENFSPAYYEDNDMHARLALANLKAYRYEGAKYYHYGSRTVKSDRKLENKNLKLVLQSQLYFIEKWGRTTVDYVDEMRQVYYKHPYDEVDKPLSYWRSPKKKLSDKLPLSITFPIVLLLNTKKRSQVVPNFKLSIKAPLILMRNWLRGIC